MAGVERELVRSTMDVVETRELSDRYTENDNLRDFWRSASGKEGIQGSQPASENISDLHHLEDQPLRHYSFLEELARESANMEAQSNMGTHHEFFEYHPYLDMNSEPIGSSSQTLGALLQPATMYTNAINGFRQEIQNPTCPFTTNEIHAPHGFPLPPLAPNGSTSANMEGVLFQTEDNTRDIEIMRRELMLGCPRSTGHFLRAFTSSVEGIGTLDHVSESGHSSDDEEGPHQEQEMSPGHDIRAAVVDHPLYNGLVLTHINIMKIGAPQGLRAKLDALTQKYEQKFEDGDHGSQLGDDPELDYFMKSYSDLLGTFGEDLEGPFNNFMAYKDNVTKQLEDICGHYVETAPDEDDNYGFDISCMEDLGGRDLDLDLVTHAGNTSLIPMGVDEDVIIDPMAPDDELKKMLRKKYGRYIGGLKAEFLRVRKKGKLPPSARQILKDWFNRHAFWPYPSEMEKVYLQRQCSLSLKQINNWFINERKRHWSCEGKCMHPNTKF